MNNIFIDNPNVRITSIFHKSLSQFRTTTSVLIIYQLGKIISSIVLTILSACESCDWSVIDLWLILVGVSSCVQLWCYTSLQKLMKNMVYHAQQPQPIIVKIAEDLHQTIYIPVDDNLIIPISEDDLLCPEEFDPNQHLTVQEEQKKINILAVQIKYEASKKNTLLKWVGQFSFLFNQALIIMGFVIEFTMPASTLSDQAGSECKGPTLIFMFIFLVLSVYQYIDLYVIIVLLLICLPFVLIFVIYQMIKQCRQKRKNQSFAIKLKKQEISYQPTIVEGDPECRICMSPYNLDEKIIVLPCNNLHHFHSNCISAWMKVSTSCPLCRKNFAEDEAGDLQQQLINQNNNL